MPNHLQRELTPSSDLFLQDMVALRQQFTVHGDVLERVGVFQYLGHLLSQDDDDIQVV